MRKNILGALVIFFVTLAFLLMLDDITNSKNTEYQGSAKAYEVSNSSEMVTTDLNEEE